MTSYLITTTGAGTFHTAPDCPVGTSILIEAWGAGAGGEGTTAGGAGGGGAYASSNYIVTPNDVSGGISYSVGSGSAGTSGSAVSAGGDTSWSTNNLNVIRNTTNVGPPVVGTPGTLPTNWSTSQNTVTTMSTQVVGFGTDNSGLPYIDFRVFGTPDATGNIQLLSDVNAPVTVTQYTVSLYLTLIAGSLTNVTVDQEVAAATGQNFSGFISSPVFTNVVPTSTQTRFSTTFTQPATAAFNWLIIQYDVTSGAAVDVTLRVAGWQLEAAASATFYKSTPGYALAAGAATHSGTTGGAGGTTAASTGSVSTFAGGAGAAENASGSGGGGSAGKTGAGANGTTAGVGGTADNGSGGAGGARATTTPGNPGTSNVEGGGGGGGLITATSGVGGAGGVPGGGGGGAATTGSTGGAGGRGQIRLTYSGSYSNAVMTFRPALQLWDH